MTATHFTPRLALPYPDETDPADVPLDIANLATKLDTITGRAAGQALSAAPVLDIGVLGQIRAGRQLTVADFTALGLSPPTGLWNLSDLTDVSGNGRALTNKGAVPFGVGINGLASTAAVFAGATAQALYIADTGAADPFRIKTGSFGCWFRTAKRGTDQSVVGKWGAQMGWLLQISHISNVIATWISTDNSGWVTAWGVSDVCDDRWHFAVGVFDGTAVRTYVDGVLEGVVSISGAIFATSSGANVGANGADGATAAGNPSYGRVDEAFVTADVLSDDQVRALYCAKLAHGYSITPTDYALSVRRRRRGAALATTDFPTQPLRLHNFTAGSLADEGSGAVALAVQGTAPVSVAGADGALGGGMNFNQSGDFGSTDAGLPSGLAARSYGCWLKTTGTVGAMGPISWGTLSSGDARMDMVSNGLLRSLSAGDVFSGSYVADGQWHFAVTVEDNAAGDGVKRKLYCDGRLVGGSTVLNAITLGGANHFRVGSYPDGTGVWNGQIDGAFVCGYALTQDQIAKLYAKGSQALAPSVKNAGDHVEYADATNVYAVFDTLDSQHTIDLAVTG